MWARQFDKFYKIGQNQKIVFFIFPHRNFYQWCGNHKLFWKTYVLSVLPKKFSWKIDKLFCPQPHLFEFCLILGILKKLHNFTTPVEISDGRKSKIDS